MRKKLLAYFMVLLLSLTFIPKVFADVDQPNQIDAYTQVYDKGGGNYRLILQTDTNKDQGEIEKFYAKALMNNFLNIDSVSAHHSHYPDEVDATYDENENVIYWTMHIFHEQVSFLPWELVFPINYLVVDFHLDDQTYGDILLFEEVKYTGEYRGPDSDYEHTFYFWQNAVRVEIPNKEVTVKTTLYKDDTFTDLADPLFDGNDEFYVEFVLENPNNAKLMTVLFSSNLDMYDALILDETYQVVDGADFVTAEETAMLDFEPYETYYIRAKLKNNASGFIGNELSVKGKAIAPSPLYFELDITEENVLGSEEYVVLKTEEQMYDYEFQAPITNDPLQNWEEGDPYKKSFEYDLTFPQLKRGPELVDEDEAIATLALDGANVTVRYLDEDGNELHDDLVLSGKVGEAYTSDAINIEGYELLTTPDNKEGLFTEVEQTVIYIYGELIDEEEPPIEEEKPPVEEEKPPVEEEKPSVPEEDGKVDSVTKPSEDKELVPAGYGLGYGPYLSIISGLYLIVRSRKED